MIKVVLVAIVNNQRVEIFEKQMSMEEIGDVGVIEYNKRFFVYEHRHTVSTTARFVETQLRMLMPSEGRVLV